MSLTVSTCVALALCAAVAFSGNRLTATRFRLTVTLVGVPGRMAAEYAQIERVIVASGMAYTKGSAIHPAVDPEGNLTGASIAERTFRITSADEPRLLHLKKQLRRVSAWHVFDLSAGSEFVRVEAAHGVSLWRLRTSLAPSSPYARGWVQTEGPAVLPGAADILIGAFLLLLLISYGSLERSREDPSSYPPGMHPATVAVQMLLIGAFACFLWMTHLSPPTGAYGTLGFAAIAALSLYSIARWLIRTQQTFENLAITGANVVMTAVTAMLFIAAVFEAVSLV